MKITLSILLLSGCSFVYGQEQSREGKVPAKETTVQSFEAYCLEHALNVVAVPSSKKVDFSGTVTYKEGASYKDYGIVLQEGKTQYYQIEGTNKMLVANSISRLKAAYSTQQ